MLHQSEGIVTLTAPCVRGLLSRRSGWSFTNVTFMFRVLITIAGSPGTKCDISNVDKLFITSSAIGIVLEAYDSKCYKATNASSVWQDRDDIVGMILIF